MQRLPGRQHCKGQQTPTQLTQHPWERLTFAVGRVKIVNTNGISPQPIDVSGIKDSRWREWQAGKHPQRTCSDSPFFDDLIHDYDSILIFQWSFTPSMISPFVCDPWYEFWSPLHCNVDNDRWLPTLKGRVDKNWIPTQTKQPLHKQYFKDIFQSLDIKYRLLITHTTCKI